AQVAGIRAAQARHDAFARLGAGRSSLPNHACIARTLRQSDFAGATPQAPISLGIWPRLVLLLSPHTREVAGSSPAAPIRIGRSAHDRSAAVGQGPPASRVAQAAPGVSSIVAGTPRCQAGLLLRSRILILDDSEHFRRTASELITARGFDVLDAVEDGDAALAAVRDECPDGVLLDINLRCSWSTGTAAPDPNVSRETTRAQRPPTRTRR